MLVPVAYAGLPQVGDTLFTSPQSKFEPTAVISLCHNFVELAFLAASEFIFMQSGTAFNIILPPLDDRVTNVRVLAVGEIRGKMGASTKYRAAIVQRKPDGTKTWGELETLDAIAFPDEAHCEVHTCTHSPTHTIVSCTLTRKRHATPVACMYNLVYRCRW